MKEITQLKNTRGEYTQFCRDCENCIELFGNRECENDRFVPVGINKSELYTSLDFDCLEFVKRPE